MTLAFATAALAAATPASATLHGFCGSGAPCTDNGSNTPTSVDPPVFGFWSSPGGEQGTLLIDILVPSNATLPSSFTMSGALSGGSTITANLFDANGAAAGTPLWNSGSLQSYLGISGTPNNPIGAYILPSGATGWAVYQASLSNITLTGSPNDAYTLLLGQGLATGSYILAYIGNPATGNFDATANSGAIREIGGVPEPATWAMMLLGFGGIGVAMRRRRKVALAQLALAKS
jgi:hypothetical protein